jgi:hypothetical protein
MIRSASGGVMTGVWPRLSPRQMLEELTHLGRIALPLNGIR